MDAKLLFSDAKHGEDYGGATWYTLPFVTVRVLENSNVKEYQGTYKHVSCLGIVKA